jgi:hypothetical protein
MPSASREPWDLAVAMSRRLQRLNVPHRMEADPLLAWASWSLRSAQLGWDMYQRAQWEGDDNHTGHPFDVVEIAAQNLVYRGVVTSMDLCAAAVFRLTRQSIKGRIEKDVNWWLEPRQRPWNLVRPSLERWLRVFDNNAAWALATELRDSLTHRTIRRRVEGTMGQTLPSLGGESGNTDENAPTPQLRSPSKLLIDGVAHDPVVLMPKLVAFGRHRYSAFERALATAYPLR